MAEFGPGDFFGEIAALDWGAGYGYARLATVVATRLLRLLVLAPAHLGLLMAELPPVDRMVRRAMQERLGEAPPADADARWRAAFSGRALATCDLGALADGSPGGKPRSAA